MWGSCWPLGRLWGAIGRPWGVLGALLGVLGAFLGVLGLTWVALGGFGVDFWWIFAGFPIDFHRFLLYFSKFAANRAIPENIEKT